MYIKRIQIGKHRILENLEMHFQPPQNGESVVNTVAGANGCGKSSLLMGIFTLPSSKDLFRVTIEMDEDIHKKYGVIKNWSRVASDFNENNQEVNGKYTSPRIISIPASLDTGYDAIKQIESRYYFCTQLHPSSLLGQAEFYIREYILSQERQSHEADPKKRTVQAVEQFNQHFADTSLLTRLHDLDSHNYNRPIFKNVNGELVTIDQLSDGEKQLYGRVVGLMILNPMDSVILIDEPELGLHPAWQQSIMKIYTSIGKNNQFIVATHSPQIIAATPIQNLIFLNKNPNTQRIEAISPQSPPTGIDVNSILRELMGADPLSNEQIELYQQYRDYVEKELEDSEEAQNIKKRILEKESDTSEFMQEMNFLF